MNLSSRALNVLAVLMSALAVITIGNRFFGKPGPDAGARITEIKQWREFADRGIFVGPVDAPVTVTVFSDFQCPFCKIVADSIGVVMRRYEGEVRMAFRNRPIDAIHAQASMAARAAVCADAFGRFGELHDMLFANQERLGSLSWEALAHDAGVADTSGFRRCREGDQPLARLTVDKKDADRLEVTGTPVVLVNELLVRGNPRGSLLDSLVRASLANRGNDR